MLLWLLCTPHCHHSFALLHILVRLIDFLISLLIFLAMSFEFSPKTHTHSFECSLLLSWRQIIFYHLQIIDDTRVSPRERESETKNCSLLWAATEDEKLGKFSAKRENSVPQTNTHSHSDTRAHVKNNRFPRKTGARVLDQSPFSSLLRLRLGVFGAVRVVLPEFEL